MQKNRRQTTSTYGTKLKRYIIYIANRGRQAIKTKKRYFHPQRFLETLNEIGEAPVKDIAKRARCSEGTARTNLKTLHEEGLVHCTLKRGQHLYRALSKKEIYNKEWRIKNKDHVREITRRSARKQRERNPEKHRQKNKEWAQKNPEKVKASNERWREENREYDLQKKREWCEKNKYMTRLKRKEWYEQNKEKLKEKRLKKKEKKEKKKKKE